MAHPPVINVVFADPGQVQVGATPLDYGTNVSIANVGGDSVLLPLAKANMTCTIVNGSTNLQGPSQANRVNVFPRLGESINTNPPNVSVALLGGNTAFTDNNYNWQINLYCVEDGNWVG